MRIVGSKAFSSIELVVKTCIPLDFLPAVFPSSSPNLEPCKSGQIVFVSFPSSAVEIRHNCLAASVRDLEHDTQVAAEPQPTNAVGPCSLPATSQQLPTYQPRDYLQCAGLYFRITTNMRASAKYGSNSDGCETSGSSSAAAVVDYLKLDW